MDAKLNNKDVRRQTKREFIRCMALGGGSLILTGSLIFTQSSCSKDERKASVVLSRPEPSKHVAACGLFCSNCSRLKSGKCKGCQIEPGYDCATRDCCIEKSIKGCWKCEEFKAPADYKNCKKVNTFMGRVWKLIYRADRPTALTMIRDQGEEAFMELKKKSGKM